MLGALHRILVALIFVASAENGLVSAKSMSLPRKRDGTDQGEEGLFTDQPPTPKKVFVTSTIYDGNLGGLAGADAKCQERANAAGLSGKYMAWLSDATDSPSTRFSKGNHVYVRVDGQVIAEGWNGLTNGNIDTLISVDEFGLPREGTVIVWTGTKADGTSADAHCDSWAGGAEYGRAGRSDRSMDEGWSFAGLGICSSFTLHLYCFEQGAPAPESVTSVTA